MRNYRGLTKEGKWVYGYFFKSWETTYILWGTTNGIPDMTEVIPETVGQFTGLNDKNGKEIYEGDIIVIYGAKYVCEYVLRSWGGEFRFWILPHKKWSDGSLREKEIIGNKWEHPNLME